MLVKKITYTDFNGTERTEDFYFNLTKSELADMELSTNGGMVQYLQKIINSPDNTTLVEVFKNIILKAYGVKSDDGRRFIKSEELSLEFSQTMAYDQLYMSLISGEGAEERAIAFIKAIIPPVDEQALAEAESKIVSIGSQA